MVNTKKHRLICQIEHDYFLIGIHAVLEDYRLAYFLNETFNICLKKTENNITFLKKEGSFSNFDYEDKSSFCYWSLINNKQFIEQQVNESQCNIFAKISSTYVLITEKKTIDYFLKIEGDFNRSKIQKLTQKLNTIHNVMTAYELQPKTLKSKDFLIF
ncbi:MAG: IPExxxVDY family protein [Flavobacteriaceae bacterium]|nr:IPExxxVDY family protein [Flavobacteriaceae bacterium]